MWRQAAERELEKARLAYLFLVFAKSEDGRNAAIIAAGKRVMYWRKEVKQTTTKELDHEGPVIPVRSPDIVQSAAVTDDSVSLHSARMTQTCDLLTP